MATQWELEGAGHWLVVAWQEALIRALEAMAGPAASAITPRLEPGNPQAWTEWPSPAWGDLVLEGVEGGAVRVGAPQQTVEMMARVISPDAVSGEDASREMFLEVINQAASTTGDVISTRLGKRVNFAPAQPCEPPPEADYAIQIVLAFEGSDYAMALAPNAALMDAVSARSSGASLPAVAAPAPAAAPPSASGPESGPASAAGAAANLDLLMEVELPLCVTFGRTQLPLKDVLKLSSGSIVELNRLVNEPVEVLINNYIIARGEVVVVEGNYGIRVTEIVSRQERIRSIL